MKIKYIFILIPVAFLSCVNQTKKHDNTVNVELLNYNSDVSNTHDSDSDTTQTIDFENYKLLDLGYISIPVNMEVQSGNLKIFMDSIKKEYGISGNRVVFQPKGTNEVEENSLSTYARVIIKTNLGNYGDFEKLTTNYTATQAELNELNSELKKDMELSALEMGGKLISWYGVSIEKINGKSALKYAYLRQLKDNPCVVTTIYMFENNDRVHTLLFEYRQSDEVTWEPLFSKILNSFVITNVR